VTEAGQEILSTESLLAVLTAGELELAGRLVDASNATLVCTATLDGTDVTCVYKPTRGERPLWDFADGTLGQREVAAYEVSAASGWDLVPPTVWREDGPFGAGMAQAWVAAGPGRAGEPGAGLVDVLPPGRVPESWREILDARGNDGRPVVLAHADAPELARMALLDVVINNADRKGGHVLRGRTPRDDTDRVYGVDHGVCFHEDDKLRTVLWGWAGEPLPADDVETLVELDCALDAGLGTTLDRLLSARELRVTRNRLRALLARATYPLPGQGWPSLPWPAF
jgi:uncharacterized repeat protein (TIGR03843 family)